VGDVRASRGLHTMVEAVLAAPPWRLDIVGPVAPGDDDGRRSAQFHALHLYRVRTTAGIVANSSGELSCSSCHKTFGASLDRETPRTTCAACHSGKTDTQTGRALFSSDTANCTSCHIQHVRDPRHWNPSLLAARDK